MTAIDASHSSNRAPSAKWRIDLAAAFAAMLVLLGMQAWAGFPTLTDLEGDNDSLLRLVEVRDMIAGQGWFDLHQYRMGPEGGFVMHWSRLVDAPIAGIIVAVAAATGSVALGETAALFLWPSLLTFLSVFLILRAARRFGGDAAMLPAAVIGAGALNFTGVFSAATLDHHNVQVTLALAMLLWLIDPARRTGSAVLAGTAAALMVAVGMETLPHVAAGGLVVALLFVFGKEADRDFARGFGLGFAGAGAIAFVATVPAQAWGAAQCDAYSVAQFALAALGGAGLAAAASLAAANSTLPRRLAAMAALGLVAAAVVAIAFPQCLADPYASLDPKLKTRWLDLVSEAQPLWKVLQYDPGMALARYLTPIIGFIAVSAAVAGRNRRREDIIVCALLAAALLVSVWQVRGTTLAIVIAVLPLSMWIARARSAAALRPSGRASAVMIAAWLTSFNITWAAAGFGVNTAIGKDEPELATAPSTCTGEKDYPALAAMPKATLLAISNLGAPMLRYTQHHVFAGPYHRNVVGNLTAIDAFLGPIDGSRAIVAKHHVDFVVSCRGNAETKIFAEWAPEGLAAALMRDEPPAWLEPVADTKGAAIELFRVVPAK